MNVNTILLNRVIEEEAYVEQPQGFEVYQKETLVCRWYIEMVLQKSGMMDCKFMENSHDDRSEEVERL
jgi:hypothetical protein